MESLLRLILIAALCTSSSNMANPGGTYLVISNYIIKKDRMLPVHSIAGLLINRVAPPPNLTLRASLIYIMIKTLYQIFSLY
jgi:hypothetical protein